MSVEQASQLFSPQAAAYAQAITESRLQDGVQVTPYAATITPTVSKAENVIVVAALTGNVTIGAPIGARTGMRLDFTFLQDGTGSRTITWNAVFAYTANGAGTANQVGATSFVYSGTRWVQTAGALAFKA